MKTKNPFTLNLSVYAITVIISFFVMMKPLTANAEKLDFNGDGKSDVFWRNSLTGETSAWLIDGGGVQYTQYGNVPYSSHWYLVDYGDFNDDGNTDLLWHDYYAVETSAWLIDGGSVQYTEYNSPTNVWVHEGVGDFNGDGTTDVFWRNYDTEVASAWLMDGGQVIQYTEYEAVSDGWEIKGFGDFNGDGTTDVFWQNFYTGATSAWLIDGEQVIQYTEYGTVEPSVGFSGWQIIGFSDFNGDGKSDIFWRNYDTGATSAWLIDGGSVQYIEYDNVPYSSGWYIAGFGDFNGDGNTDVFWHNRSNGKTSAWLIDGGQIIQYTQYGNVRSSSSDWWIEDFGDFNGDGKTDVFWRNHSNGKNVAWLINGGQIIQYLNYSTVLPSSGWYPVSFFVYYR
jgi:hypothetical protein